MDSTFLSFVPLIISLALFGFIFYRVRKGVKSEVLGPLGQRPYGTNGVLAFFIGSVYYLSPIYSIGNLSSTLTKASSENPMVLAMDGYSNYKIGCWLLLVAILVYQWRITWRLKHRWEPSSIRSVKIMLISTPFAWALGDYILGAATLGVTDFSDDAITLAKGVFGSIFWVTYFSVSKRVKNTYFPYQEKKREPVHPAARAEPLMNAEPHLPAMSTVQAEPIFPQPSPAEKGPTLSFAIEDKLTSIKRLLEQGLITHEDYDSKKKELLSGL